MDSLVYQQPTAASATVGQSSTDTLANARRQVRQLSYGSREALLRALMEQLEQDNAPLESSSSIPSLTSSPSSGGLTYFPSIKSTPRTSVSSHGSRTSVRKSLVPSPLNINKVSALPTPPPSAAPAPARSAARRTAPDNLKIRKPSAPMADAVSPTSPSQSSTRAYWCTYCGVKFDHKFEWKRHDEEVHERPKQYPCPSRSCKRIFYSAHSFNMHHRSVHGCLTCPHSEKVVRRCKPKRAWGCGFCAAFLGSLERYHEHVALHFESGKTLAHWHHEHVIYGLLHQPVIHPMWKSLQAAKSVNTSHEHRPKVSWDKETTGRTTNFALTGIDDAEGQLQDLLEYFDLTKHRADIIVKLADDEAIYVNVSTEEDLIPESPLSSPPEPPEKDTPIAKLVSRPESTNYQPSRWAPVSSNIQPAISGPARPPHMRSNSVSGTASQRAAERPLPRVFSQMYQPSTTMRRPGLEGRAATEDGGQSLSTRLHLALESPAEAKMDSFNDWNSMADTMVDGPMTPLMSPRSPRRPGGFATTNSSRQAPPLPPLPSEWMARV